MSFSKFFDRMQVWCLLLNMPRVARFFARFGTPALPAFDDRPTLKIPVFRPAPEEMQTIAGPGWSLAEMDEDGPVEVVDFDPTYNKNANVDVATEVAFPHTKWDIN